MSADDEIKGALTALELAIAKRVRDEQSRDQLTDLPNGNALESALRLLVEQQKPFWLAFVEVDKFKSINDRFGYAPANALLVKIAEQLRTAQHWFAGTTQAFRAHGDEFFMLGIAPDAVEAVAVARGLELVRQAVGAVQLPTTGAKTMSCTVSVGWVVSGDVPTAINEHSVRGAVERAVAEAKLQRDCVVQFTSALVTSTTISLRSDCSACRCKFSLDVVAANNRTAEPLRCPNCGSELTRPPSAPETAPDTPQRI